MCVCFAFKAVFLSGLDSVKSTIRIAFFLDHLCGSRIFVDDMLSIA
jgi:hypothetical protein